MPETNNQDALLFTLIGILALILLVAMMIRLAQFFSDFSHELRYINNEIGRTEGAERKHWIRRKRRLWLSLIPFIKY